MIIYYNELGKKGLEPSNYLKSFINPALYGKYKTYIATNTTKFTNSQHLLLNEIFKTKHNRR